MEDMRVEWESTFGWEGYRERVVTVYQADDGYMAVVEKALGVSPMSNTPVNRSIYMVRLDPKGKKIWDKLIAENCDRVGGALQASEGDIVVGFTAKSTQNDQSPRDIAIISVDSSGNKIWGETLGGEKDEYISSIEKTLDGGFLVTGSSNSFSAGDDYDVYLVKLNASNEKIWEKTYGGEGDESGYAIVQSSSGDCLVVGSSYSATAGNIDDLYMAKTDSSGSVLWEEFFGGRGSDIIKEVQQTSDGGLIMVGTTGSFPGWENIWLIKVDASGERTWEKVFGGDNHDCGLSVKEAADGGFIVLGDTQPFGEGSSALLIKTDSLGKKIWEKTFGENFWSTTVLQHGDDSIIVGEENGSTRIINTGPTGSQLWEKAFQDVYSNSVWQTDSESVIIAGTTNTEDRWGDIFMAKLRLDDPDQGTAVDPSIKVFLNGNLLHFDVSPIIEKGRTLVPMRAIGEALGAYVDWDGQDNKVNLIKGETYIKLKIGDPVAVVNHKAVNIDAPAIIINGRTLVPLRFIAESFEADVKWDGKETITITINH
ncbi:MAG: copper amine oxidase N-terminal domain-containing protein [Desulfocucumaceae bacterium]